MEKINSYDDIMFDKLNRCNTQYLTILDITKNSFDRVISLNRNCVFDVSQ